jgi:hypothetical protein
VAANFQLGLPVRRALLRLLGIKDRHQRGTRAIIVEEADRAKVIDTLRGAEAN